MNICVLQENWGGMLCAFVEHAKHEDECIFSEYNDFFPGISAEADAQHEALEGQALT